MELGGFRIDAVTDGTFALDGGALFGVVPKAIWEKTTLADDRNRVRLALNCLLVRGRGEVILVDTGVGDKGDEKFRSIYSVERPGGLKGSLEALGVAPPDITIVINTHLHFDHAGGNTICAPDGTVRPAFPNARYIVQKGEFEAALNPNERTRGSYRAADFVPVHEAGQLELVDSDAEVAEGVTVFRTGGHNRDIQLVRVSSCGRSILSVSDIIPTIAHLNYPYIASYDLYPLDTLEVKKRIIEDAADSGELIAMPHETTASAGEVRITDKGPVFTAAF